MWSTVKGFDIVNKAEVDVFLELSCFFSDPWQFDLWFLCLSKYNLNIWKFLVHVLLEPCLENFEHYFASMWNEYNCAVVRTFFSTAFLWDWNKNWPFPVLWPLLSFQICWHIECSTFTASSFRTWNSSARIPSPPLALLIVMLPKAHLTSDSRVSDSRWVITPLWLSGSLRSFLYSSSVYSCHLFLISSASVLSSVPVYLAQDFADQYRSWLAHAHATTLPEKEQDRHRRSEMLGFSKQVPAEGGQNLCALEVAQGEVHGRGGEADHLISPAQRSKK